MSDPERPATDHDVVEARVEAGGGLARQRRQRRLGRMSARERIDALLDAGSFQELGRYARHDLGHVSALLANNRHPGDGLVCGVGKVAGRRVAVYAHDVTVLRGSLGMAGGQKLSRLLDVALERRLPVIAMMDSDGARILEGMPAVTASGDVLRRVARLKGRVPQLTLVCGLCVGSAAYSAAMTDLVAMVRDRSFLFVTGPKVTQVATGEQVDIADLGGHEVHKTTGQCHAVVDDDAEGIAWLQRALSFLAPRLPSDDPPDRATPEIEQIVPLHDHRRPYDARRLIETLVDGGSVLELCPDFAPNLITALVRLGGRAVALLASQPKRVSGVLDVGASLKGSRHLRLARAWSLPVVTLVDVPGYMPGRAQEAAGLLPFGAELITAYEELRTPSVCLVVRKSYGGGSVMSFQADHRLAFPTARVAPTGVDAAVEVELGPPPEQPSAEDRQRRSEARARWLERNDHVWAAADAGYVDRVVAVPAARQALYDALEGLCDD